jgi:hypothetical protein
MVSSANAGVAAKAAAAASKNSRFIKSSLVALELTIPGRFAALWLCAAFWRSFFFRSTEGSHIAQAKAI